MKIVGSHNFKLYTSTPPNADINRYPRYIHNEDNIIDSIPTILYRTFMKSPHVEKIKVILGIYVDPKPLRYIGYINDIVSVSYDSHIKFNVTFYIDHINCENEDYMVMNKLTKNEQRYMNSFYLYPSFNSNNIIDKFYLLINNI